MSFTTPQSLSNSSHVSIPLGIFIGLLASFVQSLGLTIQRKSHVINQSLPKHRQRVEHRRPLWVLGFTIFILSNLFGSLVQIASLPVVILAPLGAVSLLWNAFFARFILGDVFSPWMVLGTILIAGGAVLIAVFGIVPEPTHSLEDLLELFRRPPFIVYFSLLGLGVFLSLVLTHVGEFSWSRKIEKVLEFKYSPPSTHNSSYSVDSPVLNNTLGALPDFTTLTEATPLLDRQKLQFQPPFDPSTDAAIARTPVLLAISYASISGIISGMCLIFAKSGVELLLLTLGGNNQFGHWESWVLVSGLVILALLQMLYLHKALVLANPTLVCPSAFCFYNISSIVNGLVYFNQLELIKAAYLALVALGIVILLGGVWVVSIQSGEGRVGVGAWTEEGEVILEDEGALSNSGAEYESSGLGELRCQESDSNSTIKDNFGRRPPLGPVPIDRQTRSEPLQIDLSESSNLPEIRAEGSQSPASHPQPRPHHTIYSSNTLLSPPLRARFIQRRPTMVGDTQRSGSSHQRNTSYPSNVFSPPLSSPTFGTGLQIGLSAVSPGFAIMPKERRKKLGLGEVVDHLRTRERRSVSEGDVRGSLGMYGDSESTDPNTSSNERGDVESPDDGKNGRKRWKWLKRIFVRPQ